MSLMRSAARWYLIAEHNVSLTRAIIAAETSGSIVSRIRLAWTFEYGFESNLCGESEGPILSVDRSWLFLANQTGILAVADNGNAANIQFFVRFPNLCSHNMAFSELDSILLLIDQPFQNLLVINVTNQTMSSISLKTIYSEELVGQLSKMTVLNNHRVIILVTTARRTAVLLLIDYVHQTLISSVDLGPIGEYPPNDTLTQLTVTENDDDKAVLIIAHRALGLVGIQLNQVEDRAIVLLKKILK